MESVGRSFGVDMKGESLQNRQGKKIKHRQTKQATNKEKGFKPIG